MATSKSHETWSAGALVYSGRPNPTWPVSKSVALQLQKLWDTLPPQPKPGPDPPGLGYRGAFLRGPGNREWAAFAGVVSLNTQDLFESRSDNAREFESALLASAPAGILPPKLPLGGGR